MSRKLKWRREEGTEKDFSYPTGKNYQEAEENCKTRSFICTVRQTVLGLTEQEGHAL